MLLLLLSLVGLVVPNGLFVYWLLVEWHGWGAVFQDRLAMAFILDAVMATVLLSVYFAKHPIGRVKWQWFVVLSLLGGLGFSLPFFWWLNHRDDATVRTT